MTNEQIAARLALARLGWLPIEAARELPPSARKEAYAVGIAAGAYSANQVRRAEGLPAPEASA